MKSTNPKLLIFIACLFLSQLLYSQKNFLPGFIVNNDGDTIHGYIDYRNWELTPNDINFKKNLGDLFISYKPLDIRLFSVEKEIYVSAIVNTEGSVINTALLNYDDDLKIKIDTVFLQALIQGKKELYYYKSKSGIDNFYTKTNSDFDLLIYKKYLKKYEGDPVIKENKKYIGQLTVYLHNCNSIQSVLKITKYSKRSLESLFQHYYKCTQLKIDYQNKKKEKIAVKFGFLMGGTISKIKFTGSGHENLVNYDFPQSMNFSAGLFGDLIIPRNQGRWSLYNELIYTSWSIEGEYYEFENENNYEDIYVKIGYSYLKFNNLLRCRILTGKSSLYLNLGIANGFAIDETNYSYSESKTYSVSRINEGQALKDPRKYEFSFLFGFGVKIKSFSFEARYERGNGMSSQYAGLGSPTKRAYLLLGYTF